MIEIRDYLDAVRKGKLPINHQVIYQLQEIVGLLPELGGDVELGKAFRVGVNDSSAVVYLSAMIRTVLALHDLSKSQPKSGSIPVIISGFAVLTLNAVENRITNSQQEQEDSKSAETRANEAAAEAAGVKAEDVEKAQKDAEEEKKSKKDKS